MSPIGPLTAVAAIAERPHSLLEGPRIGSGGEIVYSDVIAGGLFSCSPVGDVLELLAGRRGIGGVLAHADGGWVISGRTVIHIAADGAQRELLADEHARGYNDLFSTPTGALLAGELRYRPLAGEQPRAGRLLLLEPGGPPRTLSEEVIWPNGIALSADRESVLISDYSRAAVLAVPLAGGAAHVHCEMPRGSADGLALDELGNLWVALGQGAAVASFAPDGSLLEIVEVPASFVSSISFGGPDRRDVLISTADSTASPQLGGIILRARSEVAGASVTPVTV